MVIDNEQQLLELIHEDLIIVPIPADDRLHTTQNEIIALAIRTIIPNKSYIVGINHPEAIYNMPMEKIQEFTGQLSCTNIPLMWKHFTHNTLSGVRLLDYEMAYYLTFKKKIEQESGRMVTRYNQTMPGCKKTNSLMSLLKLQECVDNIPTLDSIPPGLDFYQKKVRGVFNWIESNGLHVDKDKHKERFGKTFSRIGDKCYTQYNYYTTTGRPSNRFGGVNYAALPKDETRECFVSGHGDDGCLVELDFNSYHPRIIAALIDYDFGKDNVYEHLAKHYHNTDTPTKDQVSKAKEDTFRQLYGGIRKDYLHIPFFAKTDNFVKSLYAKFQNGYMESPISGRRLINSNYKDLPLYTLFNYYIQMIETEMNVEMLHTMSEHFMQSGIKCKPILYTYDSVLFDVHKDHKDLLTKEIIPASIDLYKFPIKVKEGKDYGNLDFCTI
tara:strand:- start:4660 stop:5979 length:1320 start_codon:yes stop_codon:yes gene_type:complete